MKSKSLPAIRRKLPVGAEVQPEGGVHFRVWAPNKRTVAAAIESGRSRGMEIELMPEGSGYFSGKAEETGDGTLYRYRLDGNENIYPDPASRFQPQGPHGPSQVIDPEIYEWTDGGWSGSSLKGQVIYEMHIGTFTKEGTFQTAGLELQELADTGITAIEMMPIAEFPGKFGWGYDGVDLFAPSQLYGKPNALRELVDKAHSVGIGIILDVVYNHLGPDGNYLQQFSPDYFTGLHKTDWGSPINFYGKNSEPVREFFLANAGYWIDEFHMDGLRIDATQNIYDKSPSSCHIFTQIVKRVRESAHGRATIVIGENEPQDSSLIRPLEQGGYGMDALWNDDFHHSAMVAMTGHNEAYYTDYLGKPQEFISAVKWGYLYQGQRYKWQKKRRGQPALDIDPAAFVIFIQNHDQIANSGRGLRAHTMTSPGRYKAITTLMLLIPGTPMLFQGQEFASSSPFYYFADHKPEISRLAHMGRKKFLKQFRSLATREMQELIQDPSDPDLFERSKLDLSERQSHEGIYTMHRDLLKLRKNDPTFSAQRKGAIDGAVLGEEAFLLRFFSDQGEDRLLLINLGRDIHLDPAPEPLLAPPKNGLWKVIFATTDPKYGGCGTPEPDAKDGWHISGHAAVVLAPREDSRAYLGEFKWKR
ncbi:MAG: malto-oligosyltrehalose trehalohydrolase [Methanotrichaceae archaeon]